MSLPGALMCGAVVFAFSRLGVAVADGGGSAGAGRGTDAGGRLTDELPGESVASLSESAGTEVRSLGNEDDGFKRSRPFL